MFPHRPFAFFSPSKFQSSALSPQSSIPPSPRLPFSPSVQLRRLLFATILLILFDANAESVRFVAYNVDNYLPITRTIKGQQVPDAPKPEQSKEAIVEILQKLKPDILGIIEIGDRSQLTDLQNRLRDAGVDLPHTEWLQAADEARCLGLLSCYPIVARASRRRVDFEIDKIPYAMGRGILDVTVELPGNQKLRLVGTHLKSKRQVADFDSTRFRTQEAIELRKHITSILQETPKANLLVFGDLNDTKNENPIRIIIGNSDKSTALTMLELTDSRGEKWTHHWRIADIYSRIDYLLASYALSRKVNRKQSGIADSPNWRHASDHRPIFATFEFKDN